MRELIQKESTRMRQEIVVVRVAIVVVVVLLLDIK